jgi:hypothetical protein
MKKIFLVTLIFLSTLSLFNLSAQTNGVQSSGENQADNQNITTATLKSASRLFAAKDDLTSVILIIPADSQVQVLDSDSTYFHVVYQDNEGFILKRQAVIDQTPVNIQYKQQADQGVQGTQPDQNQQESRFSYLEHKYGTNMANKLMAGKIWKGMSAEMVNDSWGTADKINRIITGNTVKEEWIYRGTWLYFQNNTLLEWGAVKKQ